MNRNYVCPICNNVGKVVIKDPGHGCKKPVEYEEYCPNYNKNKGICDPWWEVEDETASD